MNPISSSFTPCPAWTCMYEQAFKGIDKVENEIIKCIEDIEKSNIRLKLLQKDADKQSSIEMAAIDLLKRLQQDIAFDPTICRYDSKQFEKPNNIPPYTWRQLLIIDVKSCVLNAGILKSAIDNKICVTIDKIAC